ncbi:MAG: 30S ribosomal protein S20 [Ignavibacteria bacterium]|nr:MAG: 30S ribosomal protein S20 [Ignavibacteria bacterium]
MPQHKSAKKRMRTNARKRAYNRMNKSRMKTAIKDLRDTQDKTVAEEKYKDVTTILDRLATKGIIHKNTAANRKSKLAKFVQTLG